MPLMARSLDSLIPGLKRQEPEAVAVLVDRTWARAYRVALQVTRDPASAEDAKLEAVAVWSLAAQYPC